MRLIRALLSLAFLGLLIYFAVAVPLGTRTLYEHLRAIAGTPESKKLVDEIKRKAARVLSPDAGPVEGRAPSDQLTPKEREALRRILRDRLKREAKP